MLILNLETNIYDSMGKWYNVLCWHPHNKQPGFAFTLTIDGTEQSLYDAQPLVPSLRHPMVFTHLAKLQYLPTNS